MLREPFSPCSSQPAPRVRRVVLLGTALAAIVASVASAEGDEGTQKVVSHQGDPAPAVAPAPAIPDPVTRGRPVRLARTLPEVQPSDIETANLLAGMCATCPPGGRERIGFVRMLDVPVTETELDATPVDRDRTAWSFAVRSPGSFRTRLEFVDLDLGRSTMYVWSEGANGPIVRGPYRGRGPDDDGGLWTASVPGDTVHIEIIGPDLPRFTLVNVVHRDVDQVDIPEIMPGEEEAPAGQSAGGEAAEAQKPKDASPGPIARPDGGSNGGGVFACHNDSMCFTTSADDVIRRATGQMNFVDGGGEFVCTGTLLNDTDTDTVAPYFLTAFHCISTETVANTLEVVWLWQRSACGGTLPDYDALPRTTGSDILKLSDTDGGNDMCFMRLDEQLPAGLALSGWTTAHPEFARGHHHPSGSWKRATLFEAVGFCPSCVCLDSSDYDYYDMVDGLVEGGASGGGIFSNTGLLFGQLFGRCGGTSDPDNMNCSNIDSYTAMYGEFETSYPLIKVYLEELGGTFWADAAHPLFLPEMGTPTFPFRTVTGAYNASFDGSQLKIRAGSYPQTLTFSKVQTIYAVNGTVTIGQ